jgi:thiamine-phosphate pyrophosphorylase
VTCPPAGGEDESEDLSLDPDFGALFQPASRASCQLYLISPPSIAEDFSVRLGAALEGGPVAAFQLRLKGAGDDEILRAAERLIPVCAAHEVAFILNDRADLALKAGADGVHLGQSDGDAREARSLLGPSAQIGVTCHDSRHLAMEAGEAGADYVAFGAFFPTTTKETQHRPDPSILSWWSTVFELPCVAIGGVTPDNGRVLVEAGADFLAVCSAVWNDPRGDATAVRAFADLLSPPSA